MAKLVGGNWKMNCTRETFREVAEFLKVPNEVDVFVAVPYVYITEFKKYLGDKVKVGAQDVSNFDSGAHTGDVSARMLAECGFEYVLVGHSERRLEHGESDKEVNEKLKQALKNKLRPVLCIGEDISRRLSGEYLMFLKKQFGDSASGVRQASFDVAYEPVWAIGSGNAANKSEIAEVLSMIKELMVGQEISGRVIYGGSVSESSVKDLTEIGSCDGFLVGGASTGKGFQAIIDCVHGFGDGGAQNGHAGPPVS